MAFGICGTVDSINILFGNVHITILEIDTEKFQGPILHAFKCGQDACTSRLGPVELVKKGASVVIKDPQLTDFDGDDAEWECAGMEFLTLE